MEWRGLSAEERQILSRILSEYFPGRDAVAAQVSTALVREIDSNGSLEFKVQSPVLAETKYRVPVEAEYSDVDGVRVHMSLHVVNKQIKELEIYREDSSEVIRKPTTHDLQVITLV